MTRNLILAASTLALAACTVGPNYRPPEAGDVPATFAGPQPAGAAIDPAKWWEAFGDPELDALVTRALKDSPDIATAASRVREARLGEVAARARQLPTVDAAANATRVQFSKNAGFATLAQQFSGGVASSGSSPASAGGVALPGSGITTFALGFDASWELDLFGGARRGVEAARARTEQAQWTARDAAVTLAAEVAQAWFSLQSDRQQIATVTDEIARRNRALQIAGNIARVGLVPAIDVTRQRESITSLEARLAPIRADAAVREHSIAVLTGQPPAALAAELASAAIPVDPVPVVPAGLPSDLLRRRPDVRAAERRLAAATADIGVAVADLYPKISLTGVGQLISTALRNLLSTDSLQATGSGGLRFPLLDFGTRRATVDQRREEREQAYQAYRSTVLTALRDVEDALTLIDAERGRGATLRQAVADADATVHAVDARYRTGLVAQNELLDAQASALQAREQVTQSDAQLRQQTAALFKAIGGGWDKPNPALTEKLPAR